MEEHGRKPKLLIDKSQTKNVTARKRALLGGPSDRIGANYTPTAKNLLLRCFFLTSSDFGANVCSNDTSRALRKRRQKCGVKPVPGARPITCCRLHSIEREKARQEEGLQVGNRIISSVSWRVAGSEQGDPFETR